jgi:hypothetical protein
MTASHHTRETTQAIARAARSRPSNPSDTGLLARRTRRVLARAQAVGQVRHYSRGNKLPADPNAISDPSLTSVRRAVTELAMCSSSLFISSALILGAFIRSMRTLVSIADSRSCSSVSCSVIWTPHVPVGSTPEYKAPRCTYPRRVSASGISRRENRATLKPS